MQKEITTITSVIIICLTIMGVAWKLGNTGISIQNTGTSSATVQNSISVSGEGKVLADPDTVQINAGISETAPTTKEAQESVNQKLNTILGILEKNDIPKKNIQTNRLLIYPEYEWTEQDGRTLIGQRVSQILTIKIAEINKNPEKATDIIDALGEINGLELNSVNFDIEEKEDLFSDAREEAFEKAKQKAKEYASLGEVTLLGPISISDATVHYDLPIFSNYARKEMDEAAGMGGGSSLPAGQLEVTANVNVVFGIK